MNAISMTPHRRVNRFTASVRVGLRITVLLGLVIVSAGGDEPTDSATDSAAKAGEQKAGEQNASDDASVVVPVPRFDLQVREDMFAGFNGDAQRLERAIRVCDAAIQADPKHAEALVWRGAAKVFKSGAAFAKQDNAGGMRLWFGGLEEMERAKKLRPNDIGILIPRAAVMIAAGRSAPPMMGQPLLRLVREDFESALSRQKDVLDEIGTHPRGELHMGLADVYRLLKQPEKSKAQLRMVVQHMADTEYAERARRWLDAPAEQVLAHNCIGCHDE